MADAVGVRLPVAGQDAVAPGVHVDDGVLAREAEAGVAQPLDGEPVVSDCHCRRYDPQDK